MATTTDRRTFASIEDAIEDVRNGKFVVVVDDPDRENEGDLVIAALRGDAFEVALIPHTLEATTLGALEPADEVNLEVDVLAKYVEKLIDRDTISG